MQDLFWWAEDTEYCHWRIPQAGYPARMARNAIVHHDAIRHGAGVPVWKYYYEARNMLYLHLHVMHRVGWYPRNITRLAAHAVMRERRGGCAGSGPSPTACSTGRPVAWGAATRWSRCASREPPPGPAPNPSTRTPRGGPGTGLSVRRPPRRRVRPPSARGHGDDGVEGEGDDSRCRAP